MGLTGTYVIKDKLLEMMAMQKHTNLTLSEESFVSVKTISRARGGERIAGDILGKLAKNFKCSPQELLDNSSSAWAVSRGGDFACLPSFTLKHDLFDVFELIVDEVSHLQRNLDSNALKISIEDSKKEISISVTSNLVAYEAQWTLRPVVFASEGVIYVHLSDWDEFHWLDVGIPLFQSISDDFTINEKAQMSKLVTPGWRAEFFDGIGLSYSSSVGEQHFPDDASFRNSINSYAKQAKIVRAELGPSATIILSIENKDRTHRKVKIQRASFGSGGVAFPASLNKHLADRIVNSINNSEFGQIDCLAGFSDYTPDFGPCSKSMSIY